jgi:hypothetical protein
MVSQKRNIKAFLTSFLTTTRRSLLGIANADGRLMVLILGETFLKVRCRSQMICMSVGFEKAVATHAADSLLSLVKEKGYKIDKILETHAHADLKTGSMMTAVDVDGSAMRYCHVPDVGSKTL